MSSSVQKRKQRKQSSFTESDTGVMKRINKALVYLVTKKFVEKLTSSDYG